MGLHVSHGCWEGAYAKFGRFRVELAAAAGIPLRLMEGYFDGGPVEALTGLVECQATEPTRGLLRMCLRGCPISWRVLRDDALHVLLNHSDCDGEIADRRDQLALANRLEEIAPKLRGIEDFYECANKFAYGLRVALSRCEPVTFG